MFDPNFDYMIMKLKDGAVTEIDTRGEYISGGCPTCDIGCERINYIAINTTKYKLTAVLASDYTFAISKDRYGYDEDDATGIEVQDLLNILDIDNPERLTEREFMNRVSTALVNTTEYIDVRVSRIGIYSEYPSANDEELMGKGRN